MRYDSPALGIDWRLDGAEALVSAKDAQAPDFDAFETPFSLEAV